LKAENFTGNLLRFAAEKSIYLKRELDCHEFLRVNPNVCEGP